MATPKKPRKSAESLSRTAVLYIRVSTEQQAESGLSLEAQEERLRAYCQLRGLEAVEVITDAAQSAGKPLSARPGGRKLLALVRRKAVGAVVALKLDRLFRNTADCLETINAWEADGVAMHLSDLGGNSVDTSSAVGRMFVTMLAGFAEFERNLTSERTKLALARKAAKGERLGGEAPYGWHYTSDGRTVAVPAEQATIELAHRLRAEGLALRAVARELASAGYTNRAGGRFEAQTVANMLRSRRATAS